MLPSAGNSSNSSSSSKRPKSGFLSFSVVSVFLLSFLSAMLLNHAGNGMTILTKKRIEIKTGTRIGNHDLFPFPYIWNVNFHLNYSRYCEMVPYYLRQFWRRLCFQSCLYVCRLSGWTMISGKVVLFRNVWKKKKKYIHTPK